MEASFSTVFIQSILNYRISNTGNGVCEVFTNMSNPNILKTTGFVYYAAVSN